MAILPLHRPTVVSNDRKLIEKLDDLDKLIVELNKNSIPFLTEQTINQEFAAIGNHMGADKELLKTIRKAKTNVMQLLSKQHNIVIKHHYRNMWLALGVGAFGVPIGVALGLAMGNIALLGIGLPIGMAIGVAIGSGLDRKAAKEDRQLDVELKW